MAQQDVFGIQRRVRTTRQAQSINKSLTALGDVIEAWAFDASTGVFPQRGHVGGIKLKSYSKSNKNIQTHKQSHTGVVSYYSTLTQRLERVGFFNLEGIRVRHIAALASTFQASLAPRIFRVARSTTFSNGFG